MVMRVWQGTTPDGYGVLVERDESDCWIVTVASVSPSRNASLETALLEAGGDSVSHAWAVRFAGVAARRWRTWFPNGRRIVLVQARRKVRSQWWPGL